MKEKLIGLVVSIIIIVGVAIVLVVGVRRVDKPNHHPNKDPLSTSSNAVAAFCGPTDFKEVCVQSLNSISNNQTATPKDYILVAINATIDAMVETIAKSEFVGRGANDSLNKMAFEDCKELFQFSIDELHDVLKNIGGTKLKVMNDRVIKLKNWLSATISYQESCLDGIGEANLKYQMSQGLVNASQLTSNLLAIVSEIVPILNSFGIETNISHSSRRLLNVPNVDKHGYPIWFSATHRKLLGRINLNNPEPHAIVAQDGTGQFRTIAAALASYPKKLQGRFVIYIKRGIYNEQVLITKDQVNIFMYGDGPRETIITGRKNNRDGVTTYQTATFGVIGNGFIGKSIGFQNTAGPEGHQAVALRVQSDMSVFYNCRMDGYQDTLYTQAHRQFYRNCVISGTVDFIFGDGNAVIQNSLIIVRKPMDGQKNTVTAQGKQDKRESTGIIIHNCRIVPEQKLFPLRFEIHTYLGRPWKQYSTTVIMQSMLADLIQPSGWMPWAGNFALDTLFFAEYMNRGPGADVSRRVNWKGYHVIVNRNYAMQYTVGPFIQGGQWLPSTGTPFLLGFKN